MADFSGLALNSMIQMQNQDINTNSKGPKIRKKSFDSPDGTNPKISSKLLKILKDNQEEFGKETNDQLDYNQSELNPNYNEIKYSNVSSSNFLLKILP